jgi:hypothetical protein
MSERLICLCGREFYQDNAYGNHQRSCKRTKKRLSGALEKAKEIFAQKRQKITHVALAPSPAPTVPFLTEGDVCDTISVSSLR